MTRSTNQPHARLAPNATEDARQAYGPHRRNRWEELETVRMHSGASCLLDEQDAQEIGAEIRYRDIGQKGLHLCKLDNIELGAIADTVGGRRYLEWRACDGVVEGKTRDDGSPMVIRCDGYVGQAIHEMVSHPVFRARLFRDHCPYSSARDPLTGKRVRTAPVPAGDEDYLRPDTFTAEQYDADQSRGMGHWLWARKDVDQPEELRPSKTLRRMRAMDEADPLSPFWCAEAPAPRAIKPTEPGVWKACLAFAEQLSAMHSQDAADRGDTSVQEQRDDARRMTREFIRRLGTAVGEMCGAKSRRDEDDMALAAGWAQWGADHAYHAGSAAMNDIAAAAGEYDREVNDRRDWARREKGAVLPDSHLADAVEVAAQAIADAGRAFTAEEPTLTTSADRLPDTQGIQCLHWVALRGDDSHTPADPALIRAAQLGAARRAVKRMTKSIADAAIVTRGRCPKFVERYRLMILRQQHARDVARRANARQAKLAKQQAERMTTLQRWDLIDTLERRQVVTATN
jgi:hypothetical protein